MCIFFFKMKFSTVCEHKYKCGLFSEEGTSMHGKTKIIGSMLVRASFMK